MPKAREFCIVLSTCRDLDEAEKIADSVLEKRLVACTNIIPRIAAAYWWQGKITRDVEALLIMKTRADSKLLTELKREVLKIHSYKNPEFIVLPISAGSVRYLEWIDKEVRK